MLRPEDEIRISEEIIGLDKQIKESALEVGKLLVDKEHDDSTLLLLHQLKINSSLLAVIALRLERIIGRSTNAAHES